MCHVQANGFAFGFCYMYKRINKDGVCGTQAQENSPLVIVKFDLNDDFGIGQF